MSGIGKWSLGIGAVFVVVAVVCGVLKFIPVAVISGILGLVALSIAVYDALYEWQTRAELRRRGARAHREQERRRGH